MAFSGEPILVKVTDNKWRLTGVSLDAGADGTIGFTDAVAPVVPEVELLSPDWQVYRLDEVTVSIQDFVEVNVIMTELDVGAAAIPIQVVKTGTTHADFLITITNQNAGEGDSSGDLEIYIERTGR